MAYGGFREIVKVDAEFTALPGERQKTICLVAREFYSGREFRLFEAGFPDRPPYATGPDVLFVAYYASADLGCYLDLGWEFPERILDLYAEFRCLKNGLFKSRNDFLTTLVTFGLNHLAPAGKHGMREALGNGTWRGLYSPDEIEFYAAADTLALEQLFLKMAPLINLNQALLRGRYMAAAARMEFNGTPIDVATLNRLRSKWGHMKGRLIQEVDQYGVYENGSFRRERFEKLLTENNIAWPVHESGVIDLQDRTFRSQAKAHPIIAPYWELRSTLSDMRLEDLQVGSDGHNRTILGAFSSKTSRNQPSSTKFIFGPSTWIRGLIKPERGYGIAYCDWKTQEFGIAAVLSGDRNAIRDYSGDVHLNFGKRAGLIPVDGTDTTHSPQRELAKQCIFGALYGQNEYGLAQRLGIPIPMAAKLQREFRESYPALYKWLAAAVGHAMLLNELNTVFGWTLHTGENPNPRSFLNFPVQGNGAEMMRLAACLATERGVEVCCPVHDAFLIRAPIDQLEADIKRMVEAMTETSRIVLGGFELRVDVKTVVWPDRYMDKRGAVMWNKVMGLLEQLEAEQLERKIA